MKTATPLSDAAFQAFAVANDASVSKKLGPLSAYRRPDMVPTDSDVADDFVCHLRSLVAARALSCASLLDSTVRHPAGRLAFARGEARVVALLLVAVGFAEAHAKQLKEVAQKAPVDERQSALERLRAAGIDVTGSEWSSSSTAVLVAHAEAHEKYHATH